jgi:predicted amidohydrolase
MRVAAVQLTAGPNRDENLEQAGRLVREASAFAPDLVALPELFSLLGPAAVMQSGPEALDGPTLRWAGRLARELGVGLLAGSVLEAAAGRPHNTSVLLDRHGETRAVYRKIHLFDNDVAGAAFEESATVAPGEEIVTAVLDLAEGPVTIGLATCYDLRFPELFRALALRGAEVIVLPSAFTAVTGRAHWETLVRARAIENQVFVVAPGQCGTTGNGIECYGHSMVVDPWGTVLGELAGEPGILTAELDLARVAEVRAQLPSLANRRPETYRLDVTG